MPLTYIQSPLANYTLPDAEAVKKQIGESIKELREGTGMSQIELSRNLGKKSATYIALIEQGKRNIAAAELARLAVHLKVDLSYFYSQKK